jgi:putative restriction endonuclease
MPKKARRHESWPVPLHAFLPSLRRERLTVVRYWWVNQNQTYRHEVRGGYLWSPKRKANAAANPYYDFMREVAPGDVVFSFADTFIRAIGFAASHAYEAPKPMEFGQAGAYWDKIGWRIDVRFSELRLPIKPAQHMDVLKPLLPLRYAPLRDNGAGLQSVYLTRVPDAMAGALVDLLGAEARDLVLGLRVAEEPLLASAVGLAEWEEHELLQVQADHALPETDRKAIVLARRGQGLFKKRVMRIEHACRITGVNREEHLRASHCKPWRDSNNEERLDGENGLLLTPSIDHLFDRGFITFENNGQVVVSPVAHSRSLAQMGIDPANPPRVGVFSTGQNQYLEFHREGVFLRSKFLEPA